MAKNASKMNPCSREFLERLASLSSPDEKLKIEKYFKSGRGEYGEGDVFLGVRMGQLFDLAREFTNMAPEELELLLESPVHEVRAGALSIMDKQARDKRLPESRREELYELYMRRHDRINNWDLVDVSAIYVVGYYLYDKPRDILYQLAQSKNMWERRTAIVSTAYFLKKQERDDTFRIGELLLYDKEELIQKATGGWLRQAGKGDQQRLLQLLDKHAATMPRTALRYAIEHLDPGQKKHYMEMKLKTTRGK